MHKTSRAGIPPLRVPFDDEYVAVVVKPQGMETLGSPDSLASSDALFGALKPPTGRHEDELRKGRPVHRLDAPTGGLVVIGKTKAAIGALCNAFAKHLVCKRYRAIVAGDMTSGQPTGLGCGRTTASPLSNYLTNTVDGAPVEGKIDEPISGAPSITRFKVVSVTKSARWGRVTTVDLWPESGRKHQLRRHLSERGHPIIGDTRFGGAAFQRQRRDGEVMCLWSLEVEFEHPRVSIMAAKSSASAATSSTTEDADTPERVRALIEEPQIFQDVRDKEAADEPPAPASAAPEVIPAAFPACGSATTADDNSDASSSSRYQQQDNKRQKTEEGDESDVI